MRNKSDEAPEVVSSVAADSTHPQARKILTAILLSDAMFHSVKMTTFF